MQSEFWMTIRAMKSAAWVNATIGGLQPVVDFHAGAHVILHAGRIEVQSLHVRDSTDCHQHLIDVELILLLVGA